MVKSGNEKPKEVVKKAAKTKAKTLWSTTMDTSKRDEHGRCSELCARCVIIGNMKTIHAPRCKLSEEYKGKESDPTPIAYFICETCTAKGWRYYRSHYVGHYVGQAKPPHHQDCGNAARAVAQSVAQNENERCIATDSDDFDLDILLQLENNDEVADAQGMMSGVGAIAKI